MFGADGALPSTAAKHLDGPSPQTAEVAAWGQVAARGLCPRCGAKTLFGGVIAFADTCSNCALNFTAFNVGDGAAAFLIMFVGGIVTLFAVLTELRFSPPFWVHILLWLPLTAALVVGSLRVAKGALIALEYRNQAREGRLEK